MTGRGRLLRDHPFPEPPPPPPERPPGPPRPRTATLRGVPLSSLRPPPPSIVETTIDTSADTVVVDTDPNEARTGMLVTARAKCTACGYLARHVRTFHEGLCGLCRANIGEPVKDL